MHGTSNTLCYIKNKYIYPCRITPAYHNHSSNTRQINNPSSSRAPLRVFEGVLGPAGVLASGVGVTCRPTTAVGCVGVECSRGSRLGIRAGTVGRRKTRAGGDPLVAARGGRAGRRKGAAGIRRRMPHVAWDSLVIPRVSLLVILFRMSPKFFGKSGGQ